MATNTGVAPSSAIMMNVDEEIHLLQKEIIRLGKRDSKDGKVKVAYGVLFKDEHCANTCSWT